jgi:hypothetical protein
MTEPPSPERLERLLPTLRHPAEEKLPGHAWAESLASKHLKGAVAVSS